MQEFVGDAEPLTKTGFKNVVDDLGVEVAGLLAVLSVESKSCGFLLDRRPIILFERHIFHKRTNGRFSANNSDVSNPTAGGYIGLAGEYPRLIKAARLDREAALMSASWGAGQVMGFNHKAAGYQDVESMVAAMQRSEDDQLLSVSGFLKANNLVKHLKSKDWAAFARSYNGPKYAKNKYDVRLAGAYNQYSSGLLPDIDVRRAQLYLSYLKFDPQGVDGIHGKMSRSAVAKFREANDLGSGDRVDKALLDMLQAKVRGL